MFEPLYVLSHLHTLNYLVNVECTRNDETKEFFDNASNRKFSFRAVVTNAFDDTTLEKVKGVVRKTHHVAHAAIVWKRK
jgi:hypothetical protein